MHAPLVLLTSSCAVSRGYRHRWPNHTVLGTLRDNSPRSARDLRRYVFLKEDLWKLNVAVIQDVAVHSKLVSLADKCPAQRKERTLPALIVGT